MSSVKQHAFTRKIVGYMYCAKCGLVLLKNEATDRKRAAPCKGG